MALTFAMLSLILAVVTGCLPMGRSQAITNLLGNPGFEDGTKNNWTSSGFTMTAVTDDVKEGTNAAKITGIRKDTQGPSQSGFTLKQGGHYEFSAWIKQLSDKNGKIWQNYKVTLSMMLPGIEAKAVKYIIAYRAFVTKDKGWVRINGSIEAPNHPIGQPTKIIIRGPDVGLDYLLDDVKLYEVEENSQWRAEADENIEKLRKSDMTFNVALADGVTASEVDLEIALTKHAFGFGAKIEEYDLGLENKTKFERFVSSWFDWATIQAYKWKFGQNPYKEPIDYSRATDANTALTKMGKTVRAHSVLWDLEKNCPEWVLNLTTSELLPEIKEHIEYMMNLTKNQEVGQWDVQNEHIHGHYYEEQLQNPNVSKDAFRQVRKLVGADGPKLYLNDFTAVTSGASTEDLYDLGVEYKKEGVPIDGLGIQGHTKEYVKPDPTAMWRRLTRLGMSGLDLMMTEFDIGWPDKAVRADWMEDSIRAFFGHPALKGVIMWGFWNGSMRNPDHDFVQGPTSNDLTILEPGERWACLVRREWMTNVTKNRGSAGASFQLRGFQGEYEVIVRRNNKAVQRETFTLGKGNKTVSFTVKNSAEVFVRRKKKAVQTFALGIGRKQVSFTVNNSSVEIAVDRREVFVPDCISHREEESLMNSSLSITNTTLSCRTVKSSLSGTGEDDSTSASCDDGELMTGCFSYHSKKKWTRKGEKMEEKDGKIQCTAYNGRSSVAGVRAYARCCKVKGLTCDYRKAGPSLVFDDAMAEARCEGTGQVALGCSSHQQHPDTRSVKPRDDLSGCLAVSGSPSSSTNFTEKTGVHAFAACCKADATMTCTSVASNFSSHKFGRSTVATCASGYVMTGCNVYAGTKRAAGALIFKNRQGDEKCKATNGAYLSSGADGVKAYATCCKMA